LWSLCSLWSQFWFGLKLAGGKHGLHADGKDPALLDQRQV